MIKEQTIAAISTPIGSSGIGIVRLSGDKAIEVVDKVFEAKNKKTLNESKTHTVHYGHIVDKKIGQVYDEVLVMLMKKPNTFTREDVVEINCHGGIIVVQKVLQLVLENGASMAEPGEFTKRAFLNGRIDLSQAEAVIDIINAKTDLSLKASVNQLDGNIANKIKPLRQKLLELLAHIEASIDYPEYDIETVTMDMIKSNTNVLIDHIKELINTADSGRIIKEGIETAIIGKPNVGKSSLMNSLLKEQRAIVTDIPGTTRDVLEEYVNLSGIPLKIMDTAGIRESQDVVEKIGVQKSKNLIDRADLILFVLDASKELSDEDLLIFDLIKDKKAIMLVNKTDLDVVLNIDNIKKMCSNCPVIQTSFLNESGLKNIEVSIRNLFFNGQINVNEQVYVTNVRHKNALVKAKNSLTQVIDSINLGMPEDCLSIDLKNCYDFLGEITGDSLNDNVIDQIFSQFCLGK